MKENYMKNFLVLLIAICFIQGFFVQKTYSMPNPWTDCKADMYCASQEAGFNFPLRVQNYTVRAMKDMIEITFPLNKRKMVTARKSQFYEGKADENGIKDISGDYNVYPVNKSIRLKNGVVFNVRGNKKKFYVINFAAETGYYSFYSSKGMNIKDINRLYNLLEQAETPKNSFCE